MFCSKRKALNIVAQRLSDLADTTTTAKLVANAEKLHRQVKQGKAGGQGPQNMTSWRIKSEQFRMACGKVVDDPVARQQAEVEYTRF